MTSEILYVKLTEVYYCAVWISILMESMKYFAICQFVCLTYTESNFDMYMLRYTWC